MRERQEIEWELDQLMMDERLQYTAAAVQINAPLALHQTDRIARITALCWVLGKDLPSFHTQSAGGERTI